MKNKKGQTIESIMGWGIGVVVLIAVIIVIYILLQKGNDAGASIGTNIIPGEEPPVAGGSASAEEVYSACEIVCANKGKGCILGIDDFDNYRSCDKTFRFEGDDDYCICGESEKVTPTPQKNAEFRCEGVCGDKGCITAIDDGSKYKPCDKFFWVEVKDDDDYCICGQSEKVTPNPPENAWYTCETVCGSNGCITGIDDADRRIGNAEYKPCDKPFRFEKNEGDDYCICGDVEKVVVNPG